MCPEGPNDCRVGQAGSQSIFRRLIVIHLFPMLDVCLRLSCRCCSCMHHVCHCVTTQSIISLFPLYTRTHTQKKIALVMRGWCHDEREVHYNSPESKQDWNKWMCWRLHKFTTSSYDQITSSLTQCIFAKPFVHGFEQGESGKEISQ